MGAIVWRPLLRATEAEVIDIHRRNGVKPNPNYLRGASRVGCHPCIFSRKSEIRRIAETDPGRIAVMRRLEEIVEGRARARAAKRGEELRNPPSFFQALSLRERLTREDGTTVLDGTCWPIDKVIGWARTSHGGRQVELFDLPPSEDGCMRWGMCDPPPRSQDV